MKSKLKSSLAATLYGTGLLSMFQSAKRSRNDVGDAVILTYHRVVDEFGDELSHTQPGMMVTHDTFERQLQFLAESYHVISLSTLVDKLRDGVRPDPRTVAITFDDGWLDNYTRAYPLLRKYGLPATIFLTTDYIGSSGTFWFHKIGLALSTQQLTEHEVRAIVYSQCVANDETVPEYIAGSILASDGNIAGDRLLESLKSLSGFTLERIADVLIDRLLRRPGSVDTRWMMNWDEVNAMSGELIDFGSHGCSHKIAVSLKPAKWEQELRDSRQIITDKIGRQIDLLAYPNGNFDQETAGLVKSVGYKAAVTTAYTSPGESVDMLYALRRIGIHEGMSVDAGGRFSASLFAFGISGWRDRLRGNL